MRRIDQKIVLVKRSSEIAVLSKQFSTRSLAKFQIVSAKKRELAGKYRLKSDSDLTREAEAVFEEISAAGQTYEDSVRQLQQDLQFDDLDLPLQTIDREFLPNFVFGANDIVVTIGQDGLVANTAKYAIGLPIVAVNPDPARIDGVLLPFRTEEARGAVRAAIQNRANFREVTLAEASLADGQRLFAFNELFIGNRTHVSARYRLSVKNQSEAQSSSGVIVSTGAGSTGWLSSVFNMAAGIESLVGKPAARKALRLQWEDPRLVFVVREPFVSKQSGVELIAGLIEGGQQISIESNMAAGGVIFSDGVEPDFLEFNAGAVANIRAARDKARLVVR